jgi:hypothetical protein
MIRKVCILSRKCTLWKNVFENRRKIRYVWQCGMLVMTVMLSSQITLTSRMIQQLNRKGKLSPTVAGKTEKETRHLAAQCQELRY